MSSRLSTQINPASPSFKTNAEAATHLVTQLQDLTHHLSLGGDEAARLRHQNTKACQDIAFTAPKIRALLFLSCLLWRAIRFMNRLYPAQA